MTRIVFLDTETTNLDTDLAEPWEIALIVRREAVDVDTAVRLVDEEYCWQLWPDLRTADPNSLRISRFYQRIQASQTAMTDGTDAVVTHTPDGSDFTGPTDSITVAGDLAHYLNGAIIIGSNPDYDVRILRRWLRRWGQAYVGHYRPIDVVTYAAGILTARGATFELPWSSEAICTAAGVDVHPDARHTGLGDTRWARDLWDAVNLKAQPFVPLAELDKHVVAAHAAAGIRTRHDAVDATYDAGAGEWIPFAHAFDGDLPFGSCQRWIHTAATRCGHMIDDHGVHPVRLNVASA